MLIKNEKGILRVLMQRDEKSLVIDCIAFIYGHYVRCKKMRYFEDSLLKPILEKQRKEKQKEGRKPEKSGE